MKKLLYGDELTIEKYRSQIDRLEAENIMYNAEIVSDKDLNELIGIN